MLSKTLKNQLFGNCKKLDPELGVIKELSHPDGLVFRWPGNDGIILTLVRRIIALENKANHLTFDKVSLDSLASILQELTDSKKVEKPKRKYTKRNKK